MPPHCLGEFVDNEPEIELGDAIPFPAEIVHHDVEVVPERFPIRFRDHDAKSFERPQHQFDIIVHKGKEEVDEVLAFFRAENADYPEIEEDDVPSSGDQQVARVGVTVKEPVLEDHLEVRVESPGPRSRAGCDPSPGSTRDRQSVPLR